MESELKTLEPGLFFRWESQPPPNALAWEQAIRSHFRDESALGMQLRFTVPEKGVWIRAGAVDADGGNEWRLSVSAGTLSNRIKRELTEFLVGKGLPATR